MPGALDGVRVLDFTHALNGPFCTMLLGHMGADIIKVEPPRGDSFRRSWMPPGSPQDSYEFLMVNTNKRSLVLNLKTEKGRELARELVSVSDVLVENYQKGTMEEFGLDYDSLKAINPRLIYACSRGYGDSGPYAAYGSNAGVNGGMAAWTYSAWEKSGTSGTRTMGIGDEAGGVSMAVGVLGALYAREQTGEGQKIEVSMQESLLGFMVSTLHEHFTDNKVGGGAPAQVADGYFTLRVPELTDGEWRELASTMERDDLLQDARFATAPDRKTNRKELERIVFGWAKGQKRQELWTKLRDLGYFGAPVLSVGEVLEDPHIQARQAFMEREHPTAGNLTLLAPWIRMEKTPTTIERVSPTVGQHSDEVLSGVLGLTPDEIADLRAGLVVA